MKLFGLGAVFVLLLGPAAGCAHHGSMMGGHSMMGGMMNQHGASCPREPAADGAQPAQQARHGGMSSGAMGEGAQQGAQHDCPPDTAAPDASQTPPADGDQHQGHHPDSQ